MNFRYGEIQLEPDLKKALYLGGSKSPVTCDFFCMKVNSILQCVNFIKYYIQNAKSVILALVANIKKSNNYT